MRRYLARGIGVLIGVPAGPLGIVFGFLVGTLVDQYRTADRPDDSFLRYLSNPAAEPPSNRLLSYVTCVCIGTLLRRHDSIDRRALQPTIDAITRRLWFGDDQERIPRRTVQQRKRRIGDVVRRTDLLAPLHFIDDIAHRGGDIDHGRLVAVVTLLAEVVKELSRLDDITLEVEDVQFIGDLVTRWGIDGTEVPSLAGIVFLLDEEACLMLGVPRTAGREEIKRSYRQLVATMHPDTSLGLDVRQQEELHGAFVRIRSAYDRLNAQLDGWITPKR